MDALRVEYRRLLLRLASRDLSHGLGVDDVAAELSDLAAGTLDAALAVADVYRFSAALNRDKKVPVWVSFPITFQVR